MFQIDDQLLSPRVQQETSEQSSELKDMSKGEEEGSARLLSQEEIE